MLHSVKKLDNSQVEISITVTPEEYSPHMEKAAKRLSDRTSVKGFRKGNVPYNIMLREVGEMGILQEAMETIVRESFYKAVTKEKLDTIGMPQINIEKIAPGNDVTYKATVALMPETKLPDLSKIKVKASEAKVDDKKMNETLEAVRGMHAKEVLKGGKAEGTDKLILDMEMSIDKVPVEGGVARDYQVYLSEDHYIPGFNEKVKGLKKDDEKEFSLEFPKDHYQKMLAGKTVDFKVKVKDVYERQLPELNDEMAKSLGQESMDKLRELIYNNLLEEARVKADQTTEIEMLDTIIDRSTFGPIPEVIMKGEKEKMFFELKRDLERNGVSIEQYLQDIKKDEAALLKDFSMQAEKRAKAALVSRQVAIEQNIKVSEDEIDAEIAHLKKMYEHNEEAQNNISRPEVRDTIATTIQNRKVMAWLKEQIMETEEDKKGDETKKEKTKK